MDLLGILMAAAALAPGDAGPPKPAAEYTLSESWRTVTPRGETVRAVSGRVTVVDGKAAWELESGRFPRSSASAAVAEGNEVVLLDRAAKLASDGAWADFERLFRPEAGKEPGLSSVAFQDLSVHLGRSAAVGLFQGRPTTRWTIDVSYRLVISTPGRASRVKHELKATIETLPWREAAASPFDRMSRLFPLRGEALAAVEAELARVEGFPVLVRIDGASEPSGEVVLSKGLPEAASTPAKTTATILRQVSGLSVHGARPEDVARLTPGEVRSVAWTRLVDEGGGLR